MNSHRKLLAWQACRELAREIYLVTRSFPVSERFGLTSQLRRAAISVMSNLAEGLGRWGPGESAHGASVSLGSLAELDSLIVVAEDIGLVDAPCAGRILAMHTHASKLVFGLHRRMRELKAKG